MELLTSKKSSTAVIASPAKGGAKRSLFVYLSFLILVMGVSCVNVIKLNQNDSFEASNWRSVRKDAQNTGFDPSPIPTPNSLLWKHDTKRPLKSSPIIMGDVVVIGSLDKRVHFLDAVSGKGRGVYKVPASVSTSACGQTTARLGEEDATLFFGLDKGKDTFFALDLETGQILWKKKLGEVSSSPTICGEKILVGTSDGTSWALDKATGEKIWQFEAKSTIVSTPACYNFSSASNEELLCFGSTDGYVYALNSENGEMKWKFKAKGGIYSSPAIKAEKIFFGSVDGNLYALKIQDGSFIWKFQTEADIYSSPAITESLVYIGSNDYHMYAVNQKTGELIWKFKTEGLVRSSPIAMGDKLFFGSYDGNFYVLNRFTGELLWKYQTKGMISSSPAYYDGKVYIASEDGFLYCFGK